MDWLGPIGEVAAFAFPFLERLPVIRAILGFVLVFFLPGFAWTLVLFRQIAPVERVLLSLALSIAVVTLSLFVINMLFGMRIGGLNAVIVIIVITVIPIAVYYLTRRMRKREKDDGQ